MLAQARCAINYSHALSTKTVEPSKTRMMEQRAASLRY
jgi:hypothetical protein